MADFLSQSVFFGAVLSLAAFQVGLYCKKKWHLAIFNPLLIATALVIGILAIFKIPYDVYYSGAKYISYLLTPATVCLAIPLYEQLELLKKNALAILAGILSGVLTSVTMVLLFAVVFHFSHTEYVTFLPKSVTTAIGMGVSEQLGGNVSITVAVIVITGVLGNMLAEPVCRVLSITNPIAKGIGIGSAAHAIGTAKAMELGEVEGAMSGLSIAVSGILTVFAAAVFGMLY
ncbi:MAG: LrgB family protein [Candidatus Faecousia sp.]|nr:LrgB family protein [Candidatus Faecousia sp.]